MIICKVIGHIWSTKKEPSLEGLKLMIVQEKGREQDPPLVAADVVGAGVGEDVLVVSGSTARKAVGRDNVPADLAIVGIIDTVEVKREDAGEGRAAVLAKAAARKADTRKGATAKKPAAKTKTTKKGAGKKA